MAACPNCGGFSRGDEPCEKCATERKSAQASAAGSTILAWLLAALVVGGVWTMTDGPPSSQVATAPDAKSGHLVKYVVTGTGNASLTYQNRTGGTDQITVPLPWQIQFQAQRGAFLYLSAQKQQEFGTITAVIEVNGNEVQRAKANTAYGIASVSGRL